MMDDACMPGGQAATVPAPLHHLPLLVRGGHLLPTTEAGRPVLHLYGAAGSGLAYSDAGDGYGAWRVDRVGWQQHDADVRLTWESDGAYPLDAAGFDIVAHGFHAEEAWLDQQRLEQTAPGRWHLPPTRQAAMQRTAVVVKRRNVGGSSLDDQATG
jgi:alpha-glucosidase